MIYDLRVLLLLKIIVLKCFFCCSFYLGKHSGRQLSLQPSLGSADLNAVFFGSTSTNAAVTLSKRESGDMTEEGAAGPSTSNTSLTAKTQAPKKHIIQVASPPPF